MFMHVPCWQLPRVQRLLREKGAFDGMLTAPGYWTVLKAAASKAGAGAFEPRGAGRGVIGASLAPRRAFIPRQHPLAGAAAYAGAAALSRRRGHADLAADRGGAGRNGPAAAVLGLRLGRRAGAGALSARPSGRGRGPAVDRLRHGLGHRRHRRDARRRGQSARSGHRPVLRRRRRAERRGQRRRGRVQPATICWRPGRQPPT